MAHNSLRHVVSDCHVVCSWKNTLVVSACLFVSFFFLLLACIPLYICRLFIHFKWSWLWPCKSVYEDKTTQTCVLRVIPYRAERLRLASVLACGVLTLLQFTGSSPSLTAATVSIQPTVQNSFLNLRSSLWLPLPQCLVNREFSLGF